MRLRASVSGGRACASLNLNGLVRCGCRSLQVSFLLADCVERYELWRFWVAYGLIVMKDAKDAVQRAYAGRNPLRTVFASEPTEQEYQRLLASLNDDGRGAVVDAMRFYNHYGQQVENSKGVGIAPSLGRKTATRSAFEAPFSLDQVRRQSLGMSTGTPFNLDRVRSLSVGM